MTADLDGVRDRNRSWTIIRNGDGSCTALRAWHGSQQIITSPDPAELDKWLTALDLAMNGRLPG